MYTLNITGPGHEMTTLHDTPAAALTALHDYLVRADCYHSPTQLGEHSAYELLALSHGRPRVVGVATIETYRPSPSPSRPTAFASAAG